MGKASWSLFLLLSCVPINRVIEVCYASSRHFFLFSDSAFDTGLGAISPIRISTSPSFLEGDYRAVVKITTTPIEKDSVSTPMTGYALRCETILFKDEKGMGCRTLSSRRIYSGLFHGAVPRAHFLLYILINTFNTKLNSLASPHAQIVSNHILLPPIPHFNHPHLTPPLSQLHPSTLLFLPVLLSFLPAYVLGTFT